jgi:uncharacterized protein
VALLDAASDLQGRDLGQGDVALGWSYPGDIVVQAVVFDVFGSDDALDVFRTRYAQGVAALGTTLSGFGFAGDRYFTVVARRGDQVSLPSRLVRLAVVPAPVVLVSPGGTGDGGVSGTGFPFAVSPSGGVFAQGGDALLRSKLLQLLLTVPGERVNLPEYGTRLVDLVFEPNSDVLSATTEFTVARAIQRYLGDVIQLDRVQISNDESMLKVDISYVKKSDLRAAQVRIGLPLSTGPAP